MKKLFSILLSVVMLSCVFCVSVPVSAETVYSGTVYYFDSVNGNDGNSGTSQGSPKKTVDAANKLSLKSGDALLFKRGCVFEDTNLVFSASGTAEKPITASCYGDNSDDLPVLRQTDSFATSPEVYIKNQSYITVDSIHIIGAFSSQKGYAGVKIESSGGKVNYGNVIKNCIIETSTSYWTASAGNGFTGVLVESVDYYGFYDGITIENNDLKNIKGSGISINGCYGGCNYQGTVSAKSAKNVHVINNYLENIGKDGIVVNNCNAPIVEYNTCNKAHSYAMDTWHVGMWPFACYRALFQYNESYNTQTTNDGQGFDCDYLCYYTTFQYNYSHDNTGGFMLICTEPEASWLNPTTAYNVGVTVRYNISQNDKHHTFCLTCHITDTMIYNNTIFGTSGIESIVYVYSRDGKKMPINTMFYNNIFYTNSGKFTWLKATGTEFKNNLVYGSNSSLYPKNDDNGGNSDTIEASGNIYADPHFVNAGGASVGRASCSAYYLKSGSPAIGAGMLIYNSMNTNDFFGNSISPTAKPNIGAYNGVAIGSQKGDANSDGEINMKDALTVAKYLVSENSVYIDLSAANVYDSDSVVTAKDMMILKRYLARIITEF